MSKETFTNWLAGTRTIREASSAGLLAVAVRSRYAQESISRRLQPVIKRTVAEIAGYRLDVCFAVAPIQRDYE